MIDITMPVQQPDNLAAIKKEAKTILKMCTYIDHLKQLRNYQDWGKFDWSFMAQWANAIDDPFVNLMRSLSAHHYTYNAISMHRWWRRLKAVNQQHIITYFTYVNFTTSTSITWSDVYDQCFKTADILAQYKKQFSDDRAVELNLRALLGISMASDIKAAWIEFAKTNHPDKGGSVDRFVLVKSAYEEYCAKE